MASCGADLEANRLMSSLLSDALFPVPLIDLDGPEFTFPSGALGEKLKALTVTDVTNGAVDGPGAFDALMRGFKSHLEKEFDAGRITGDDYTKAYIALTGEAMQNAVAFLLGKDGAFWQAQMTQVQAFAERVKLEIAKVEMATTQYTASKMRAEYALTKMQMATEEVTYCTAKYNLEEALPKNVVNLTLQGNMLREQTEAQRAQTMDTRLDGAPVTGVLGKQKALYAQQIISYERDAELKAARLWSDAWITQKTIDEGLTPPTEFTNANVNTILTSIRQKNGL